MLNLESDSHWQVSSYPHTQRKTTLALSMRIGHLFHCSLVSLWWVALYPYVQIISGSSWAPGGLVHSTPSSLQKFIIKCVGGWLVMNFCKVYCGEIHQPGAHAAAVTFNLYSNHCLASGGGGEWANWCHLPAHLHHCSSRLQLPVVVAASNLGACM